MAKKIKRICKATAPRVESSIDLITFDSSSSSNVEKDQAKVYSKEKNSSSSIKEYKNFMSSRIRKNNLALSEAHAVAIKAENQHLKGPATKQDQELDKLEDKLDQQVALLTAETVMNDYTASELQGRDRVRYMQQRMIDLGAKPPKPLKVSLPLHLGFLKAAKKRVEKAVVDQKNLGTYTSRSVKDLMAQEPALAKRREAARAQISKKGKKDSVFGGKVKNGVLRVSKEAIEKIERGKGHKASRKK